MKLNDTYFDTAQYNSPAWRALVTCQEIGHTFGLDHQDEDFGNANLGTCMDYTNDPSSNQHPSDHDFDQLVAIYSHQDSTSTVGGAASAGRSSGLGVAASGNTPGSWGRLVDGSRAAGHSTYVRNDGGAKLLVTFVTWA